MQAQEKPLVVAAECKEVAEVQRFGEPAEFEQVAAPGRLREHFVRRGMQALFVARAQRRVIADRAPVRHGEHRLEHAEHGIAVVEDGPSGAFVARHRARLLEAGGIEFDHADVGPVGETGRRVRRTRRAQSVEFSRWQSKKHAQANRRLADSAAGRRARACVGVVQARLRSREPARK